MKFLTYTIGILCFFAFCLSVLYNGLEQLFVLKLGRQEMVLDIQALTLYGGIVSIIPTIRDAYKGGEFYKGKDFCLSWMYWFIVCVFSFIVLYSVIDLVAVIYR